MEVTGNKRAMGEQGDATAKAQTIGPWGGLLAGVPSSSTPRAAKRTAFRTCVRKGLDKHCD